MSLETVIATPDSRSLNLHLTNPSEGEFHKIYSLSYHAWGDALTLSHYLEEAAYMTTVPLAKDGGMTVWMLTDKTLAVDQRPILASCETFRKRAFTREVDGHFSEVIVHGVASVLCDPKYRGRGYAVRMLLELKKLLPGWRAKSMKCVGSILYSDIGKHYYSRLGWNPCPTNTHIVLDPLESQSPLQVKHISEEDLAQLCKDDETLIRISMTKSPSSRMQMMIVPDIDHMLWHHRKEEFSCRKHFGKQPRIKGVVVREHGSRLWVMWTRRYYQHPESGSSKNVLYILRFLVESPCAQSQQKGFQAKQLQTLFRAAQNEAAEWKLGSVRCWDPSGLAQNLLAQTDLEYQVVEREEESIASLLWFGESTGRDHSPEWLCNEKYAWC